MTREEDIAVQQRQTTAWVAWIQAEASRTHETPMEVFQRLHIAWDEWP